MSRVSSNILQRVYLLFGIFIFLGALVILRVIGLQVNQDTWTQKESEKKVFFNKVVADRGSILSENGEILATSLPFYRIGLDPMILDTMEIAQFRDSLYTLSKLFAIHFGELEWDTLKVNDTLFVPYQRKDTMGVYKMVMDAMREGDRHVYLTRKSLNFKDLNRVSQWPILNLGRYKGGFSVEKIHNKRYYPYGDLAKVTLGVMMHDTVGVRGIEASYNSELKGRDGYILAQKVSGKSYIPLDQYGEDESEDGMDITTTLDVDLQDIVENVLRRGVENTSAKAGTAILMEVETGKVKALANWPETYNYAIADRIEPGSTFKIAAAAAILEDTLFALNDTIDTGEGKINFEEWEIRDDAAYGEIPFRKVVSRSSNVGMFMLVDTLYKEHPEQFLDHMRRFGFYEPANDQMKGEPEPLIHEPGDEMFTEITLPNMAYGYSVEVTPLQMASFYNALANDGKRMRPWIIKEIRKNSKLYKQFGPEVMEEKMVGEQTLADLNVMMEEVVNEGTARRAFRNMPFQVAGKTGTVRKFINGKYRKVYRASFGGYFPSDNPRYTIYVMVDAPQARYVSGGSIAAPIFRDIALGIHRMDVKMAKVKEGKEGRKFRLPKAANMPIEKAEMAYAGIRLETSQVPDSVAWVIPKNEEDSVNLQTMAMREYRVPNLRGMTARDAVHLLENMGVSVSLFGMGRVRSQTLQPGFIIGENTAISLYLK